MVNDIDHKKEENNVHKSDEPTNQIIEKRNNPIKLISFKKYQSQRLVYESKEYRVLDNHPNLDLDFFNYIRTKEQAYVLGLFCADGWIEINRLKLNRIGIGFDVKDLECLEIFCGLTGANINIASKTENCTYYRLRFINDKIAFDIKNLVNVVDKSHLLRFPELGNCKLDLAFLLGYFDGDGTTGTTRITSGSKEFLKDIQKKFIGCNYKITQKESNAKINGRKVIGTAYVMYLGSDLFIKMMNNFNNSLKRKRMKFSSKEEIKEKQKYNAWKGGSDKKINIDKEKLKELSLLYPMSKIAEIYDVSGKTIANYFDEYGIKRPNRGYWSKKRQQSK